MNDLPYLNRANVDRLDIHLHAAGEDVRDSVQIAMWLYPKGETPAHRTYLTGFQALRGFISSKAVGGARNVDIPPNQIGRAHV